jgi:hypothetical protein
MRRRRRDRGANMILVDFHPAPRQARLMVHDTTARGIAPIPRMQIAHEAYQKRLTLAERYRETAVPIPGL